MRQLIGGLACAMITGRAAACELCAIYSASNARGEAVGGFQFTVQEQFVHYEDLRYEGEPFKSPAFFEGSYWNDSITHLVPTYNFSKRFGLSLNAPIVYREFNRYEIRYAAPGGVLRSQVHNERGTVFGLGDVALIGRYTLLQKTAMKYSWSFNLLGGVKFPTGDTDRLQDETEQARLAISFLGPAHDHNVLPVHQSDLSLGTGSFDGIFGAAGYARWSRYFFNSQIQYYLRTEAYDYKFGNELFVSGGPGAYLLLNEKYTFSLQGNIFYETEARDEVFGRKSNSSGITSWYFGPLLNFTWGNRLSATAGFEFPWHGYNHGLQIVSDYRVRAGITWRF